MNLFNIVLIDFILVMFPLLLYVIYSIYTKTIDSETNNLYLDCALFSSYYLLLKFGILNIKGMSVLFFDIPLVIAYLKNKKVSIVFLTILVIFNYYNILNINPLIIIVEYFIYYLLYIIYRKKNFTDNFFINMYIIIKIIFYTISVMINYKLIMNSYILTIITFLIITKFIIYLYNKIYSIIDLYKQINNIKQEEEIKKSLFNITHEIKNPIAVCKGYLDMIDINDTKKTRSYIPIIKDEINRVLLLLEDFLSITKIKIEKEEMDLNMLLEDTVKCLSPILDNKKIQFISDITDDEIYIYADYNRLKQTLVNIIKNSRESIENEGYIRLYTNIFKNNIEICVEDSGIGMNEEELKHIKQAFYSTKTRGTGLGVFLANEIITSHNGKMDYFSKKNKGTKVVITLPI